MCTLIKCFECYNETQESSILTNLILAYNNDRNIVFGTPPSSIDELEPETIYVEFQHKGECVPWYMLLYDVPPKRKDN